MNRAAVLYVVVLLVVTGVAGPGAASSPDAAADVTTTGEPPGSTMGASNDTGGLDAPGARLSGVVGVQAAEVDGEIDGRAFGHRIAGARTNDSRAAVVAAEVRDLEGRLQALQEREQALSEARAEGEVTPARYRAETAVLAARAGALQAQADRTAAASRGLPGDHLESRGMNATAIEALRTHAGNITGPDAARIGQSIGGPDAGRGLGSAGPDSIEPPASGPPEHERPTSPGVYGNVSTNSTTSPEASIVPGLRSNESDGATDVGANGPSSELPDYLPLHPYHP